MNIISQLYRGRIISSQASDENVERLRELERLIDSNLAKLQDTLCDKGKITLEKYKDCVDEYTLLICEQAFVEGFSVAVKLMTEAYSNPYNLQE